MVTSSTSWSNVNTEGGGGGVMLGVCVCEGGWGCWEGGGGVIDSHVNMYIPIVVIAI